jgi:putative phosphoesterase
MERMERIGVISDTHGLLRPEAVEGLRGCALIIHAGDIGEPQVLNDLRTLAPVVAVRGNRDKGAWAAALPTSEVVEFGADLIYVLHDRAELDLEPRGAGMAAVISGHTHEPSIETRDGVLYLNPGSAGPRRRQLPISIAVLEVEGRGLSARIVDLAGAPAPAAEPSVAADGEPR